MSAPAERTHARRVDDCLRRVLDALRPLEQDIESAAAVLGRTATLTAHPRAFMRVRDAIADAEPWPMELLGPVIVTRSETVEGRLEPKNLAAWFTRGHHGAEQFQLFAIAEARKQGLTLIARAGMPTEHCWHAFWLPPNPEAGRVTWNPVPIDHLDERVPVTVWTPAS